MDKIEKISIRTNRSIIKLVTYTILIMGIILTLLIGSHDYYKDIVIRSQQENILNIVTTVSSQLEEHFNVKDNYLKRIVNDKEFLKDFESLKADNESSVRLIEMLYRIGKEEYVAIELIDEEGKLLKAYSDNASYQYVAGEDIINAVAAHDDIYYVDTLGDQSINIIHAVKLEDDLYGFVRMKLNADYIYQIYIVNYRLHQTGYISLKDNKGRLFLHPSWQNIGMDVIQARKSQFPEYDWTELDNLVKQQLNMETGVGTYHSIWPGDGTRVKKINAFTPSFIGDTFIILNFSVDYKETMYSFEGITKATIAIAILLILTSLIIIIYIYIVEVKKSELELEGIYFKELKKKNALLIHQSKYAAMGEMIATIAHQLKQPLNALKLAQYNIEDYHKFEEKDEVYLDTLLKSNHRFIDKISRTIDDFKCFFKPQDTNTEFNVFEAIEFAIELNMARLNDLQIIINVHGNKTIKLIGESNILSQVILNLINNSIDALKEINDDRKIDIYIKENISTVEIQLRDNGNGFKKVILENLFEPYVTTKGENGTGLGLYIAKYILKEKFDGKLIIENTIEGVKETVVLPKR